MAIACRRLDKGTIITDDLLGTSSPLSFRLKAGFYSLSLSLSSHTHTHTHTHTLTDVGDRFTLNTTVLEGHRFAVRPIPEGQPLLSWSLPFGYAICQIGTKCSPKRKLFLITFLLLMLSIKRREHMYATRVY